MLPESVSVPDPLFVMAKAPEMLPARMRLAPLIMLMLVAKAIALFTVSVSLPVALVMAALAPVKFSVPSPMLKPIVKLFAAAVGV